MQETAGESDVVTDQEFDRNGLKEPDSWQPGSAGGGDEMNAADIVIVTVK